MKSKFVLASFCVLFLSVSAFAERPEAEDHGGGSPVQTGGTSDSMINVDSIFQKFKKRHEDTIRALQEAGEMADKLVKTDFPPNSVTTAAIATELIRLKREIPLIQAWESGAIDKSEYVTLMAENSIVLDHLQRFAAFAKASYSIWENRTGPLNKDDFFAAAAREFDKFYTEADKKKSAFYDVEIRDLAKDGRKTLPIFQATWAPDIDKRMAFRAKYYSDYADRLLKKNEPILEEYRAQLEKSKASTGGAIGDGM